MNDTSLACSAIAVDRLSAGYSGNRAAISEITFSAERGEQIGILGPNGAGKSTLFKAIVGLIPHWGGEISIQGEDCRTSHNLVGYVSQFENIDWSFPVTVRDVVMMGRTRKIGWILPPTPKHWRVVDELLDRVGLVDFRHRQIGELSGGQKRRVFIARALAKETQVLLLDEPFSGVDYAAEDDITIVLNRLSSEGITLLISTHDVGRAPNLFDKILLMNQNLVAFGTPDDVFLPQILKDTFGKYITVIPNSPHAVLFAERKP